MAEQHNLERMDYISRLPDELLLIILSKLNMVDGARTTVLSSRWRTNLWQFPGSRSSLRLDASDLMPCYAEYWQGYHKDCQGMAMNIKFEDIVDQTLAHYTPPVLDELHVSYVPCKFQTKIGPRKPWAKVDSWIDFAKQKHVKTLELGCEKFKLFPDEPYKQPSPLKSLTSTTFFSLVTLRLKHPPAFTEPGSPIQTLLSSCPNLEDLSIVTSNSFLTFVLIQGSSLKLKHLELIGVRIGELIIYAPNLISFNYIGSRERGIEIRLRCVPALTRLSFSELDYSRYSVTKLDYVKLEIHKLYSSPYRRFRMTASRLLFLPTLRNLEHFKLTLGRAVHEWLRFLSRFLGSTPSLRTLSLDLGFITCPKMSGKWFIAINQCLEEVEIDGFAGFDNEVQLVMRIAQVSPSLKKIMIRPSLSKFSLDQRADIYTEKHQVEAAVQSLQLSLPQLEFVTRFPSLW